MKSDAYNITCTCRRWACKAAVCTPQAAVVHSNRGQAKLGFGQGQSWGQRILTEWQQCWACQLLAGEHHLCQVTSGTLASQAAMTFLIVADSASAGSEQSSAADILAALLVESVPGLIIWLWH